jgi:hypothetical protein
MFFIPLLIIGFSVAPFLFIPPFNHCPSKHYKHQHGGDAYNGFAATRKMFNAWYHCLFWLEFNGYLSK